MNGMQNAFGKVGDATKTVGKTVVSGVNKGVKASTKTVVKGATLTVGGAGKAAGAVMGGGVKATSAIVGGGVKTVGAVVGGVTGVATTTIGATVGVAGKTADIMRSTMSRKHRYNGGRRLKRQNSRLAWDSRVTAPHIKLDLVIECQRLPRKNSFSEADAFCVIWAIPAGHRLDQTVSKLPARHEKELGRTEVARKNRNPRFTTTFRLDYRFQEEQHFVVRVYNEDLEYSTDLREHDFVGGSYFTLGELMGAGGCSVARHLSQKAFLILIGQEIIETREVLEFRFSGQDLGLLERKHKNMQKVAKDVAKDVFDTMQKVGANVLEKFNLYFRFERLHTEDQTWKTVWKSEVIKDTQHPTWGAARTPLQLLCSDDPHTTVRITIWDWNRFSHDVMVGFVETTVNEMTKKSMRGIPVFNVMIEKKRILGGTKLKKAGILKVLKANIIQIPSMLQYISGGCRMDLMFAIDCTIGNGDWREETSQHYHSSTWLNDYQAAIHKIATVYGAFEGEKDYAMWGYGASTNGQQTQVPFLMGENLKDADALIEAYDRHFSPDNEAFELGENGYLKPVIQAGMYRAIKSNQKAQCYSTLVILTTGELADVTDTMDVICAAAEDAPLSIVIIGVGTDDFQFMEMLEGQGDESGKLRHSNGVPLARELVNFVTFHEFGGNASQCVVEALREVPEQFVQYFLNSGIKPLPPKPPPDFSCEDAKGPSRKHGRHKHKKKKKHKSRSFRDDDSSESDY